MVRYSDILGKIAKKQGARPSQSEAPASADLQRTRQVPVPDSLLKPTGHPGMPGPLSDPTEQISKSVMARLFSSVLDTPPEAPRLSPLPQEQAPAFSRTANSSARLAGETDDKLARKTPPKGFRNHAELLKFASLLINDVEDMLKA